MDNNFMPQFGESNQPGNQPGNQSGNSLGPNPTSSQDPFAAQSQTAQNQAQNQTPFGSQSQNGTFPGPSGQPVFGPSGAPQSQPNQPKPKNPNSINTNLVILSVVLGVVALIAIVVAVWLGVNNSSKKKTDTPVATPTVTETEIISAKTFGFYPSKITNPTADVIYRLGVHRSTADGNGVFGAYINTENTAVDLYIYWQYIADYYGVTTGSTDRQLATIPFEQPVADIAIGETGQSVGGDVLLFLMADGTVEYMPVVKALSSQDFRSYGQLAGIADVVKFYHVDAVSDTGDWSGYVTTLAQREDGSIVDLQNFMKATLVDNTTSGESE